jgi:hypothetical protein
VASDFSLLLNFLQSFFNFFSQFFCVTKYIYNVQSRRTHACSDASLSNLPNGVGVRSHARPAARHEKVYPKYRNRNSIYGGQLVIYGLIDLTSEALGHQYPLQEFTSAASCIALHGGISFEFAFDRMRAYPEG